MIKRDPRIDFLRVLGTILVIMAHTGAPTLIQNIRTFDVSMLMFISGMSFVFSYKDISLKNYMKKRVKKLLIPTYTLLFFIFVFSFLACTISNRDQLFSLYDIFHSFLLLNDGMGYIWIVRVYIMIALFSWFSIKLFETNKYLVKKCLCLIAVLLILCEAGGFLYGTNISLDSYIIEVIPYCLVFFLGMMVAKFPKCLNFMILLSGIVLIIMQIWYNFHDAGFSPDSYKYPPSIYYLSYGLTVTGILLKISPNIHLRVLEWLSKNSFTIYLFHILILLAYSFLEDLFAAPLLSMWVIKFFIILLASITASLIWDRLRIKLKGMQKNEVIRKDIK